MAMPSGVEAAASAAGILPVRSTSSLMRVNVRSDSSSAAMAAFSSRNSATFVESVPNGRSF